jgi:hypothetical protein
MSPEGEVYKDPLRGSFGSVNLLGRVVVITFVATSNHSSKCSHA